jgi:hypothetical protein
MVLQYSQAPDFYNFSGHFNLEKGDYAQAAFYYRKLYMVNKDTTLPAIIIKSYLQANNPQQALAFDQYKYRFYSFGMISQSKMNRVKSCQTYVRKLIRLKLMQWLSFPFYWFALTSAGDHSTSTNPASA